MNSPEHVKRFKAALSSKNPSGEIFNLATSLRDEGISQVEIYMLFEQFLIATSGDDPRYDAMADSMDLIVSGAWAKGRGLFTTELTEELMDEYRKSR